MTRNHPSQSSEKPSAKNESFANPESKWLSLHQGLQLLAGVMVVVALVVAFVLVKPGSAVDATSSDVGAPVQTANTTAKVTPTGKTTTVRLSVKGMSYSQSNISVPAGNKLTVIFKNTGDQRHDLVLSNGAKTPTIAAGATTTLDAGVISSNLEGWCSLPGHRQMGMYLTVTATGAAESSGSAPAPGSGMDAMGGMDMGGRGKDVTAPSMAALQKQAAKEKAADPALAPLSSEKDHFYTLTVTEGKQTLANNVTRQVWTYNKTAPGPVLHGRVGDTFHVTLINKGSMGHSIDFHAGQSNPQRVMKTIEPGQKLNYTFTADHAGIWLYHCSTMPMSNHIANGMYGAVVVEPDGLDPVSAQYVMVYGEEYLGANGGPADPAKVASMMPDIATFNGRAFQYDAHPITVKAGEKIRIWVLDAGPNSPLSFHVVGAHFTTVWKEGSYTVRNASSPGMASGSTASQALGLQPAEGGFVELSMAEAGKYTMVNHVMSLAEKGAHGILKVTE